MPTKSSYQRRPRCSTGSTACAAIARATSSVMTKPCAPWNSLSAGRPLPARAGRAGRRAALGEKGKARQRGCHAASGIGGAGRAGCAASRTGQGGGQVSGAMRASRSPASAGTGRAAGSSVMSQSLSTMRSRPSPSAWFAGPWVWPCTSVAAPRPARASACGIGIDVGEGLAGARLRPPRVRMIGPIAPDGSARAAKALCTRATTTVAEAQVLGVVQAQSVAVRQQPAVAKARTASDRPAASRRCARRTRRRPGSRGCRA